MNRLAQLDPATATGKTKDLFDGVQSDILTNYLNHVARTVVDFPEVKAGQPEVPAEAGSTAGCGCA